MRATYYGEVVAIRDGQYMTYVIKNLDEPNNSLLRYVTVTIPPNWEHYNLDIGTIGYFTCEYVSAGETYIKHTTGEQCVYAYSVCYLVNFIEKQEKSLTKEFNF
jgi:hypothetical protein